MTKVFFKVSLVLLTCIILSCKKNTEKINKIKNLIPKITNAVEFEKLVIVDSSGVTGADGVISFPFNDSISVFMMGDSFLSPVRNKKRNVESTMINNTFILVNRSEETHTALYSGTLEYPDALLKPAYGNPKEYYWPGHGFEDQGILHLFMSRFLHVNNTGWGFEFSGTDYIRMDKNTFSVLSQEDFTYSNLNKVHYGHSVINEDDFTYIYGSKSDNTSTSLHLARAKLNIEDRTLGSCEFFNGVDWVSNPLLSRPLKGINKSIPEQFSVFKHKNLYILVMQDKNIISGDIVSYIADTPVGPWRNEKLLYHTIEQNNTADKIFTYNAMAHPQYITDNKLLVSYCVNSFDVPKIHEVNTDYYRPRFIWIPLSMILE